MMVQLVDNGVEKNGSNSFFSLHVIPVVIISLEHKSIILLGLHFNHPSDNLKTWVYIHLLSRERFFLSRNNIKDLGRRKNKLLSGSSSRCFGFVIYEKI